MKQYNITWKYADYMSIPYCYKMQSRDLRKPAGNDYDAYRREVDQWMRQNNCGEWVHKYMVKFKHESHVTLFLLRWV